MIVRRTEQTRARETHQLLGGLVLEGGGGDLVVLRQKLVVVRLLEVELDVLKRLTLAKVVVVLRGSNKPAVGGNVGSMGQLTAFCVTAIICATAWVSWLTSVPLLRRTSAMYRARTSMRH